MNFKLIIVVSFVLVGFSWACGSEETTSDVGLDDVGFSDAELPDVGQSSGNACGGDVELLFEGHQSEPGDPCGPCADGVLACDGADHLQCMRPTVANECGGCEPLSGRAGDSCGPCDSGSWECDGSGGLECVGALEHNECGGCANLDGQPSHLCDAADDEIGMWSCTGADDVRCALPEENACGGDFELSFEPGTPCGQCDGGVWACDGRDDVVCENPEAGINDCGGCEELFGVLEEECGRCSGEWACESEDSLFCDDPEFNACGGCKDLGDQVPGQSCGGDEVYICDGEDSVLCPGLSTNACGGSEPLENGAMQSCGVCDDGSYICAAPNQTACLGEGPTNGCGGCSELQGQPGYRCGSAEVWACDGDNAVICVEDSDSVPPTPQGVTATNGIAEEHVRVSWTSAPSAAGYLVYRDQELIAEVDDTGSASHVFDDMEADAAGVPGAPAISQVIDGAEFVRIEFDAADVSKGAWHVYTVVATNAVGESATSSGASGRRGPREVTGYEIRADGGAWQDVSHGELMAHEDWDADQPLITVDADGGSASNGTYIEYVELGVTGVSTTDGEARDYEVRAINLSGESDASEAQTGYRPVGEMSFEWQSSPDAGSDISDGFSTIPGQDTSISSHQDIEAPADGSPLHYQVVVRADGAEDEFVYAGTGYRAAMPAVNTLDVSDVELESVTLHGEIISLGAPEATEYGFCFGTSPNPNACESMGNPDETGSFSEQMDQLSPGVTYFVRAYILNGSGIVYGDDLNFATDMDPVDWAQVSTGNDHSCAVGTEGTLWCWGDGGSGRLGLGDEDNRNSPARVGIDSDWSHVSAGRSHSCGIRNDDTLWCWGGGGGKLGLGDTESYDTPQQVGDDDDWTYVTASLNHSCGIRDDGTLWCWGSGANGRLGLGDMDSRDTPHQVGDKTGWVSVSATGSHSCGIRENDDKIWCWGMNQSGQLGNGESEDPWSTGDNVDQDTPQEVLENGNWLSVATGVNHTCAVRQNGTLWCWGSNHRGQLGVGDLSLRETPTQVGTSTDWAAASGGWSFSCGVRVDNSLWCWGEGEDGKLGLGHSSNQRTPQQVDSNIAWVDVDLGQSHGCAVSEDNRLSCWGFQDLGQLGQGEVTVESVDYPVAIDSSLYFQDISAGLFNSCAVATEGTLWCWGRGEDGALGLGDIVDRVPSPRQVGVSDQWHQLSDSEGYSDNHRCAIRDDDRSLWCWGNGMSGRLGLGDNSNRTTPTRVGTDRWQSVSAGSGHSCGIQEDESLWCWGNNFRGALGVGNHISPNEPHQVGVDADWKSVSAGRNHSCGVRAGGELWCWGGGYSGQLGLDDREDNETPQRVGNDMDWDEVVAGEDATCAIRTDRTLWCWGDGENGRLGLGDTDDRITPGQVGDDDANWSLVSLGEVHTCGVQEDGTLWCWGGGSLGQLGLGDTDARMIPEQVGDGTDWSNVSVGRFHTLGIDASGEGWAWGANTGGGGAFESNLSGQLGDGTAWKDMPVEVFAP